MVTITTKPILTSVEYEMRKWCSSILGIEDNRWQQTYGTNIWQPQFIFTNDADATLFRLRFSEHI